MLVTKLHHRRIVLVPTVVVVGRAVLATLFDRRCREEREGSHAGIKHDTGIRTLGCIEGASHWMFLRVGRLVSLLQDSLLPEWRRALV